MRALCILALALVLARPAPLTVTATRELVTWSGTAGACVYWVNPTGARYRLGCARGTSYELRPGDLYEGDVVEVRSPGPAGTARGRAVVGP